MMCNDDFYEAVSNEEAEEINKNTTQKMVAELGSNLDKTSQSRLCYRYTIWQRHLRDKD